MKRLKIWLTALGIIIILGIGFKVYLELDHHMYYNKMEQMNQHQTLEVQVAEPIEHKTLEMPDYKVHYYVSGKENKDLIVFLHPAFSDHRAFNQQINAFSEAYKVITIDLIGHGLSKANGSKDQIDASSEHIKKIMEKEGAEKAHLVGVSIGSLIAQDFAFKYPNKTQSLTALGGYNIHHENKEVEKTQRASNLGLVLKAIFSMKSFRKQTAKVSCQSERGQALFYLTTDRYERKSFLTMQGLKNIVQNRDVQQSFPLLILVGEYDIDVAKDMAKAWHNEIKHSEFYTIQNAGHCANIDEPLQFNKIVKTFLEKH